MATEEEQNVINAARRLVSKSLRENHFSNQFINEILSLEHAIARLDTQRPVPPYEGRAGYVFRFSPESKQRPENLGPFILVRLYGHQFMYMDTNGDVYDFNQDDEIIQDLKPSNS